MYDYRDFATGKTRRTRGRFAGWTQPTGLLKARYAIFRNPKGDVLVPEYLLTLQSKSDIAAIEGRDIRNES